MSLDEEKLKQLPPSTFITVLDSAHPDVRVMNKNFCRGEPLVAFYDFADPELADLPTEQFDSMFRWRRKRLSSARDSILELSELGLIAGVNTSQFHDSVLRNFRSLRMTGEIVEHVEVTMPGLGANVTANNYANVVVCMEENGATEEKMKFVEKMKSEGHTWSEWENRATMGLQAVSNGGKDLLGHTL